MTDDRLDRPNLETAEGPSAGDGSLPPSHLLPRTRDGRIATVAWLALFLLAMPPVTHTLLDRPEDWVAGVPFFFAALLVIYTALIGVLLWALRRGV
jgi:hypothetical protein